MCALVTGVQTCALPILRELVSRFPEMEHRLLDMRDVELVAAQDRMVLLGRKTPMEKIATFLLEISARQEGWGWPASPVTLSMTRGDIADYLGQNGRASWRESECKIVENSVGAGALKNNNKHMLIKHCRSFND